MTLRHGRDSCNRTWLPAVDTKPWNLTLHSRTCSTQQNLILQHRRTWFYAVEPDSTLCNLTLHSRPGSTLHHKTWLYAVEPDSTEKSMTLCHGHDSCNRTWVFLVDSTSWKITLRSGARLMALGPDSNCGVWHYTLCRCRLYAVESEHDLLQHTVQCTYTVAAPSAQENLATEHKASCKVGSDRGTLYLCKVGSFNIIKPIGVRHPKTLHTKKNSRIYNTGSSMQCCSL